MYGFVETGADGFGVDAGSWGVAVLKGFAPESFRGSARANFDDYR
jgi:hypothetical protein